MWFELPSLGLGQDQGTERFGGDDNAGAATLPEFD
jgi:hypothetical protein